VASSLHEASFHSIPLRPYTQKIGFFFLKIFKIIVVQGYNVTFTKVLAICHSEFNPFIILLFPSTPIPRIISTDLIFFHYVHEYFHHIHPPSLFPYILPLPLLPTPQTGPDLHSCALFWKHSCSLFKIAIQGISL
jgi:hypothetical protein